MKVGLRSFPPSVPPTIASAQDHLRPCPWQRYETNSLSPSLGALEADHRQAGKSARLLLLVRWLAATNKPTNMQECTAAFLYRRLAGEYMAVQCGGLATVLVGGPLGDVEIKILDDE